MGVAVQTPLRVSVRGLVASEVPDDQGLVAGRGQEHVGAASKQSAQLYPTISAQRKAAAPDSCCLYILLEGGSEGSNPASVALEGATENQLLGHDVR